MRPALALGAIYYTSRRCRRRVVHARRIASKLRALGAAGDITLSPSSSRQENSREGRREWNRSDSSARSRRNGGASRTRFSGGREGGEHLGRDVHYPRVAQGGRISGRYSSARLSGSPWPASMRVVFPFAKARDDFMVSALSLSLSLFRSFALSSRGLSHTVIFKARS